jgi:hypothetical protein
MWLQLLEQLGQEQESLALLELALLQLVQVLLVLPLRKA